jgi:hypothetical protein
VSNAPLCWISTDSLGLLVETSNSHLEALGPKPKDLSGNSAVCSMTNRYAPNVPIVVALRITPSPIVGAWGLEEQVPIGWAVTDVSHGGRFFSSGGILKFGIFYDSTPRTLTYHITPARETAGIVTFVGAASFDGASLTISGDRQLMPSMVLRAPAFSRRSGFQLQVTDPEGSTCILQASTNLTNWISLQTNVNSPDTLQFLDATATNFGRRFYRAVSH